MRVTTPSTFFVLDADKFGNAMREWFPMAVHLLEGVFFGKKNTQQIIDQRERLLALGSLSAGLTHELNNPAAAAVRATASLRERVAGMRHKLGMVASGTYDRDALVTLMRLQEEVAEVVAKAPTLTPLEASDREDSLGEWFEDHSIREGWDLAPTFVQAGLDTAWLENVAAAVDESVLEGAIRWLNYTIESELLMNEIADSTTRISTLVGAAKQYSQMDRAPFQTIDVHELLDSTLIMLGQKIGSGIEVVKEYDLALPPIDAYAAELNQVWTNLIDNAVSAMDGSGTLTVRTSRDGDRVCIEICDTGAGFPMTSSTGSSNPSSRLSLLVREPVSALIFRGELWSASIMVSFESRRSPVTPGSEFCCPSRARRGIRATTSHLARPVGKAHDEMTDFSQREGGP